MEAHGAPPNYGWAGSFFSNYPQYAIQTTTSLMEGVGLSASGGNAQDTTNTKQFIVFPSVEGAMMFKADYIERYNGNYARWFSRDADRQAVYRSNLEGVRPRIVNSF